MQIVLGSRGDYTVRAMLYLARNPGRQSRHAIAEAMDIPEAYLPQILGPLVRAGMVRSTPGRLGGYALDQAAESISLRNVIEVAEGPIEVHRCILRGGPCYWEEKCALHDAWSSAQKALIERLARTTFAELAQTDWELEQASPRRPPEPGSPRPPHDPRVHRGGQAD